MPITVGSNTYNLVTIPAYPGVSDISLTMSDSVAVVQSPFVPSQVQTQTWPGADLWTVDFTLPKMSLQTAAPWRAFMAGLIGQQNVFQMGDPFGTVPQGVAHGSPVAVTTVDVTNLVNSYVLSTEGWEPSINNQLMAGDYIQVGYRLYVVTSNVNSDSSGNALVNLWPSLRDSVSNGTALTLTNTLGLFRLASNTRSWHGDFTKALQISLKAVEVR